MSYLPLVRKFLAGAGLLMFGLYLFEEAIKSLGGRQLKRLLEAQTKTLRKGMRAGTRMSALTTSSTFVSLLLVAFVGAGLLGLHNAIGVIIGANIGTTLNSLRVAYMGFGEFKIAKYALPLIAVGGLIHMITKNKTWLYIAHICIGIGLLFVGLDYMKESVDTIAESIDLTQYHNLRAFGIVGLVVTALLHSQAAMFIITLAALNGGIITLGPAFAVIIGANIGTTMTALTAALGGSRAHKQVALAHFFQNVFAALMGIIFFSRFRWLCEDWLAVQLGYVGNNVLATAWFNTIFNIVTAIPFMFFPHLFVRFIEYLTPHGTTQTHRFMIEKFRGIGPVQDTKGIQLNALLTDCKYIKEELEAYILTIANKETSVEEVNYKEHIYTEEERMSLYHKLKEDIDFLYNALIPLQQSGLTRSDIAKVKQIESYLEIITNIAKSYKSLSNNLDDLRHTNKEVFIDLVHHLEEQIVNKNMTLSELLVDLQHVFVPVINAAVEDHDIDIPSLISTQHGLSQAFSYSQKLNEIVNRT